LDLGFLAILESICEPFVLLYLYKHLRKGKTLT
jgi:hypothetical protein